MKKLSLLSTFLFIAYFSFAQESLRIFKYVESCKRIEGETSNCHYLELTNGATASIDFNNKSIIMVAPTKDVALRWILKFIGEPTYFVANNDELIQTIPVVDTTSGIQIEIVIGNSAILLVYKNLLFSFSNK